MSQKKLIVLNVLGYVLTAFVIPHCFGRPFLVLGLYFGFLSAAYAVIYRIWSKEWEPVIFFLSSSMLIFNSIARNLFEYLFLEKDWDYDYPGSLRDSFLVVALAIVIGFFGWFIERRKS